MSTLHMRKAGRSASHCSGVSAAAAVVITVVTAITGAEIAAPVSAAAAEDQDEDDDKPQAGAVIVSVVEPHESHLASKYSMRQRPVWGLTI